MITQFFSAYSSFMNAHKVAGTIISVAGIAGSTYLGVTTVKTVGKLGEKIIDSKMPISVSNGSVSVSLNQNPLNNSPKPISYDPHRDLGSACDQSA